MLIAALESGVTKKIFLMRKGATTMKKIMTRGKTAAAVFLGENSFEMRSSCIGSGAIACMFVISASRKG